MSVIEFSLMSIEVDPFNKNNHTDLMIPMCSRWKKILISAAWHNTYYFKFTNELFPSSGPGPCDFQADHSWCLASSQALG